MIKVGTEYPGWTRVTPMIPCEPCVFTALNPPIVRAYEAGLLSELQWPSKSTASEKATCVRVMASQLIPLLQEYAQLRDHLQGYMAKLDFWHQNHLIPQMTRMAATLESLTQEMQHLKLREFVRGEARVPSCPNSVPPSVISAQTSIAESIAEAQAIAASKRNPGHATFYSDHGQPRCSGSVHGHGEHSHEAISIPNPPLVTPSQEQGQGGIPSPMIMMMPNPPQVVTHLGCGECLPYPGPGGGMPSTYPDAPSPGGDPTHSDPIGLVLSHLTAKDPDDILPCEAPEAQPKSSASSRPAVTLSVPKSAEPDALHDNMAGSSSGGGPI